MLDPVTSGASWPRDRSARDCGFGRAIDEGHLPAGSNACNWGAALRSVASAILAGIVLAAPLAAGEAQDQLFELGVLDAVTTGQSLSYAHARAGTAADPNVLRPITDGDVELRIVDDIETGGRDALVTLREGARARDLTPFPAEAGNPLLMVFMETNVRSMAAATGGSPHYIRNRMREALRTQDRAETVAVVLDGRSIEARRFSFRPFDDDPNAARMGAFADLEISFLVSEEVPGRFAMLEAVTGAGPDGAPALRETIILAGIEADE